MSNSSLIEFYRGWMIEVVKTTDGFWSFYHSPEGEKLGDRMLYIHPHHAQAAAMQLIDQFFSCYALNEYLREAYELGQLAFDEWQQLSGSLIERSRSQFVRSHF